MIRLRDWPDAATLSDLGELVARWVEGKLAGCPLSQESGPDPETAQIAPWLAPFNRAGLVTTFSQPGVSIDKAGCGQRAALEAYAAEDLARRVGTLTLFTDLIVFLFEPGGEGGYQVPVTVDGFHPYTWCGGGPKLALGKVKKVCSAAALNALRSAWLVKVIDPAWGRKRYLWHTVETALSPEFEASPFRTEPAESHDLDTDFLR